MRRVAALLLWSSLLSIASGAQPVPSAARLRAGAEVPLAPPLVVGGGEVVFDVTVDRDGRVAAMTPAVSTPPFTELLTDACRSFDLHCARGIEPNLERIQQHLDESLMLVTALNPHIGYEKAAAIALKAHHEGLSLRDAAIASGHVTAEQFAEWVRPARMARPHEGG